MAGTPEEVVLNFGVHAEPFARPEADDIPISTRVVMNFYTAKRFSSALTTAIERHEEAFGEIEVDVRKRLQDGE